MRGEDLTLPGSAVLRTPIYSFGSLSEKQQKQLIMGSGHTAPEDEISQINSSTAFAVNFYKAFEECQKKCNPQFDVEFEWRESVPVKGSNAPANIDVKYTLGNTVYFVECKYLEPYYMRVKPNSAAYTNPKRMPIPEGAGVWTKLCYDVNNMVTDLDGRYTNFDAPQICRHLLAVYRHIKEDDTGYYKDKKIVMQSMSWRMTDGFITAAEEAGMKESVLIEIRNQIEREIKDYEVLINSFIGLPELDWDCRFECRHYNDELQMISDSSKYNQIVFQYFR